MFLIHVFYDDRCSYYPAPNMRSGVEKICQGPRRHVRIVSRSYMSGCYPWRPVPGCPWHIHSLDGKSHSTPSCVTPRRSRQPLVPQNLRRGSFVGGRVASGQVVCSHVCLQHPIHAGQVSAHVATSQHQESRRRRHFSLRIHHGMPLSMDGGPNGCPNGCPAIERRSGPVVGPGSRPNV